MPYKDPERRKEYHREYNRSIGVHKRREYVYGVTKDEWDAKLEAQGGGCAICGTPENLCLDHNHETGEFRGILCRKDNAALGILGDSAEGLMKAIDYLGGFHAD